MTTTQRTRKRQRVIFSSDVESDNEGIDTGLPPSDPPSESSSSHDDADGMPIQTSDDIPLMKQFHHNAGRLSSTMHPFPGPDDSPNLASQST
jgi:hypothetical protein